MSYLIVKEIIPLSNKNGDVSFVDKRTHLVLSKRGRYEFSDPRPIRYHLSKNGDSDIIDYFGNSSYLIFSCIEWKEDSLILIYSTYIFNPLSKEIKKKEESETIQFSCPEDGVAYISIGRKYFVKLKVCGKEDIIRKKIGSLFEFSHSCSPVQV